MKTIKIAIIALVMVFAMQVAHSQVRIGVNIGAPYGYGYYHRPVYYGPAYYPHGGYYARPYYHAYYRGRGGYRRRW